MAEATVRKRPVRPARPAPAKRSPRAAAVRPLEDEAPRTNYALRLTEGIEEEVPAATVRRGLRPSSQEDTFALKLSEALQAISSAQNAETPIAPKSEPQKTNFLAALDKLPPIKLPVGPAIPWRLGLPALIVVVVLMVLVGRPTSAADTQGVQLPAQQTYSVQQEAPLFAKPQPTDTTQAQAPSPAPQQVGVPETQSFGLDLADIGLKLIVVLALAYGSLMLLKRFGIGGAGVQSGGSKAAAMRVVSSLALAPNRSLHVVELPGGKTLLVGATPNAVNLLASLDEPS